MTLVELTVNAAATAAFIAAGYALYQAIKGSGTVSTRSDDPPIRVKGGSVFCDSDGEDWDFDATKPEIERKKPNTNLKYWNVKVYLDGVPDVQTGINCKTVEVEMAVSASTTTTETECKVAGGVRVTQPGTLKHDAAKDPKRLYHSDPTSYIKHVRLKGGLAPKNYGPFTEAQSKLLEVVLDPWEK